MEPPVVRSRGRPRKRRRKEEEMEALEAKRQALATRSIALVGRFVLKEFPKIGVFLGKVVYYECGLYRVSYEDGDFEDLDSGEVRAVLLNDSDFDDDLTKRKGKLEQLVLKNSVKVQAKSVKASDEMNKDESKVDGPVSGELNGENGEEQAEGGDDLLSDDYSDSDAEAVPAVPPRPPLLQLPPSSGTIGVPEQCVSHLFAVYGFLRSFSTRLFLAPFTLDDFVGCLNCRVANSLIDSIHVSLLRVLRHHLESVSSEGSELASKCLRCNDWGLLDALTWPVFVIQYLLVNGHTKGPEWKGFYDEAFACEYYLLPVSRKLMILQKLCDDVLDSEELKAEMNMREESEVGVDYDAEDIIAAENGPGKVLPRHANTACEDKGAMKIVLASNFVNQHVNPNNSNSRNAGNVGDGDDRNGDECRLCGMDGTLLCCDGCPSAYHSRCIGVSKMHIPEGPWYCPECKINMIGPTVAKGTSLRGAEIFGMDLYGQLFMSSCDHLLVLNVNNDEFCLKYYNQSDIPNVIQVLCGSLQHRPIYYDICMAVMQYWNISERVLPLPPPSSEDGHKPVSLVNGEYSHTLSLIYSGNVVPSRDISTTNTVNQCPESSGNELPTTNMKLPQETRMVSLMSNDSGSVSVSNQSELNYRSSVNGLTVVASSRSLINSQYSNNAHSNDIVLPVNFSLETKESTRVGFGKVEHKTTNNVGYMGLSYKPLSYINNYMHGDFAASAAAKLAVLSSEESRSEGHVSDSQKKTIAQITYLQAKAFSQIASRFFWPATEKKLMEVPRERCGWCFSCKAPVSSKRGCMLNHALINATKSALKVLAGFPPLRSGEGILPSIATYILYMEECLHGLIVGPFLSPSYRKQWRMRVEQATTFSSIKPLLLDLEENIRMITFCGDWHKLMDDWLVEFSMIQRSASALGTTQKRAPSGRRYKKRSATEEPTADGCHESLEWWRGGKFTKFIFQKAVLPRSLVRKAARQGGSRKISGIFYADGSEIPKRTRQFVWRVAVQMCKTASQLALQVLYSLLYLDFYIRWSDLIRPEQNIQDGKGQETDASAFRNANICDKKLVEGKTCYGVAFGSQKHLSTRLMKNVIEIEQGIEGKEKYWFSETRIPLYLVKEYEESNGNGPSVGEHLNTASQQLLSRWLKASRKDIFFYLTCKRDNLDMFLCSVCHTGVPLRNALKCNTCQGFCHEGCSLRSTIFTNKKVEYLTTCNQCYHAKFLAQKETSNESPTSPLLLQGRENNSLTILKGLKSKYSDLAQKSAKAKDSRPEAKQAKQVASMTVLKEAKTSTKSKDSHPDRKQLASGSSSATATHRRNCSWGVIWKKKNIDDTGDEFRLKNILLKGASGILQEPPICHLCRKKYCSDLMYIHCESCSNWYHAEAVELDESKIFDVLGFKCCKCRRIKSPDCPYADTKRKTQEGKRTRTSKKEYSGPDSDSGTFSDMKECEPATPVFPVEDDPLLFSLSSVELVTEPKLEDAEWSTLSGPGPRKLPVRRHVKREGDCDGFYVEKPLYDETLAHNEAGDTYKPEPLDYDSVVPNDSNLLNEAEGSQYEFADFEPHTYFSVTELLLPDDSSQLEGADASGELSGYLGNSCTQVPEECGVTLDDKSEPALSFEDAVYSCWQCGQMEPAPDLCCEICGIFIHSQCSPWVESPSRLGNWRCGNCREWQ
ncbi:hypothetical protein Ahy_B03g068612 isoform B [Arachis hypogaea]|uniref:PHD-type domain-containing protein n=1 Tax=Arachis hypogaea TaxID=3818 RepID=A0A445AAA2_ARAHY|nr:hypothetical protein Ahy_B03g068612 isoform B [Arachis hypogaea]